MISYLLKQVLNERLAQRGQPQLPVKIVIDEAHRYLPAGTSELSRNGIFQVLREGRKVNLQLVLTTQSPLDLPVRLRSQFGIILIHRLLDPEELASIAPKLSFDEVARLKPGQAILKQRSLPATSVQVQVPR